MDDSRPSPSSVRQGFGTVRPSLSDEIPLFTVRITRASGDSESCSSVKRASLVSRLRGPFAGAANIGSESATDRTITTLALSFFDDMTPPIPSEGCVELEERSSPKGVTFEPFSLLGWGSAHDAMQHTAHLSRRHR